MDAQRDASMRPRVIPAEDVRLHPGGRVRMGRFNEAAGNPRGRLSAALVCLSTTDGFNEAAGNPRGRLGSEAIPAEVSEALQ